MQSIVNEKPKTVTPIKLPNPAKSPTTLTSRAKINSCMRQLRLNNILMVLRDKYISQIK
jgi:hypothetical protein